LVEQDVVHAIKSPYRRIGVGRLDALDAAFWLGSTALASLRHEYVASRREIALTPGKALNESTLSGLNA
jgi:hypothetical protein